MSQKSLFSNEVFCQGFFSGAYLSLGTLSLVSKFVMPMMVAGAEGAIWLTYIVWDLWWLAYFYVGWKIQYPSRTVWTFSILCALADFFISAWKLFALSRAPIWGYWQASQFFNNFFSFLLAFFLFFYLFSHSTRKIFGVEKPSAS